jgi:hypothetical protein
MDLFIALSLLIAIALILLCVKREKLVNVAAFRKAVADFTVAVLAHNAAVDLFAMVPPPGVWVILFRIVAWIFLVLSFRQLCMAFGAPLEEPAPAPPKPQ